MKNGTLIQQAAYLSSLNPYDLTNSSIFSNNGQITYSTSPSLIDPDGVGLELIVSANIAFKYLENVTGIPFVNLGANNTNADFLFKDEDSGAYELSQSLGQNFKAYTDINIPADWPNGSDATDILTGYYYQTVVHEILHGMGLGHLGPYNGGSGPMYPDSVEFSTDSWLNSIMSYVDPSENPNVNAGKYYLQTPMAADFLALDLLYGNQTYTQQNGTLRKFGSQVSMLGDTIYGFNSNLSKADFPILGYLSDYAHNNAYCIVDGGGVDTFDFSGWSEDQFINLRVTKDVDYGPTTSSVAGAWGNLTLAVGTVIENAVGGSGNDTIFGNFTSNILNGSDGSDILVGFGGDDLLTGGTGSDTFVLSLGSGTDVVTDFKIGTDSLHFYDFNTETYISTNEIVVGYNNDGYRFFEIYDGSRIVLEGIINSNPTGAVTISGTSREGETLTAVTSTISDTDGLGSAVFSYQWLRDGSSITGATSSTYVLTQSDVGAEISVTVSYTDGYGAFESLTSSATSSVVNVNESPTGSVTISGTLTEGETLAAVTSTISDADGLDSAGFSYQWLRDGSSITGATSSTYVLTQSDVGAEISVTVSYTDGYGAFESLTSSASALVTPPPADIALTIGTQSSAKLGNKWGSLTDADGLVTASFDVTDTSKDLTLSLTGYDIDYGDEISLKLNGKSIGYLSAGRDNGTSSHSVTLSSSDLQSGTNTIEFVQSIPAWKWGVGDLLISEVVGEVTSSSSDIALTIGTQSSAKLGNKWGSLTDADGLVTASFDVTDTSKDLTLSLTGYDIDYGDEISLKLNGKSIGYLSAGRDNGTSSHSVTLSSSDLQSGTNTIEFVQSIPAWKWGVGDLLISEVVGEVTSSSSDIALTIGTQSSAKLGNKWGSLTDADGLVTASFDVTDTSKDLTLSLTGYDIDYGDEISLKLNGKSIGYLSAGRDNGTSSHSVTLSSSDLQSGTNTIEFVQSIPAWKWGVGDLLISEVVGEVTSSSSDIALTIGTQSSAKLGNKWGSLTDADGLVTASFDVTDTSKDLTLSLTGYDIDYGDEISLKLNGKSIGYLSAGRDNGTSSHSVTLSSSDLQSGTNTIEFVQSIPAWKWGVGDLLISEVVGEVTSSSSDIALTIGTQSSAKLGNKWGSLTDADGLVTASFDVTDTSKDLTLSLTGYDIDYGDEISLKLNGKSIGYLSAGRDNGTSSHSVTLSSSDLQSGTNTIEFVQSIPAWKWGVGDLLISEVVGEVTSSSSDIALTIGTQSSAKLGNKWGSLTDADGLVTASFDVTDTSKDLTLSLTGYDIDYGDEISLKLNGKSIGYLSAGRDNGTSSHSVTLSSSDLQSGTNTIEFVQSIPAWKWGVGDLLISEVVGEVTSSSSDIALTIGTQSSAKLGNKWGSLTDADGLVTASFDVTDTSKDLTLSLTGYDIDYGDEISLKLNGKSIGYLSAGRDNGTSSHSVTLSSSDLQSGTNTIEFVQSIPAWKWGVGDLLISEVVGEVTSSSSDIALTIGTQSSAKLGNKWGSLTDADGLVTASFDVTDTSKDLTLSLTGYDIDYGDEISLKLNGKSIGYLSAGRDNGTSSHSVTLSSSDLQSGTNTIEFVQSIPAWKWGVGDMLLTQGDSTPFTQSDLDAAVAAALTSFVDPTPFSQQDLDLISMAYYAAGVASVDITSDNAAVIAAALASADGLSPFSSADIAAAEAAATTSALTDVHGVVYATVDVAFDSGVNSVDVTINDAEVVAAAIASVQAGTYYSHLRTYQEHLTSNGSSGCACCSCQVIKQLQALETPYSQSDIDGAVQVALTNYDNLTPYNQSDLDQAAIVALADGVASVDITSDNASVIAAALESHIDTTPFTQSDIDQATTAAATAALTASNGVVYSSVDDAILAGSASVDVTSNDAEVIAAAIAEYLQQNDSPTGSVTVRGTATEGETLTAVTSTIADADGLGSFGYQWLRDGSSITGATSSTYTLTQSDVGAEISVTVSYTDGNGTSESLTSSATSSVANANDSPTGSVTVSGTATEGETLTAVTSTIVDADGLGSFGYQWLRDGSSITGATSSTYTLTQSDVGTEISVTVSYTDGYGTSESLTSSVTSSVANANDSPTGSVTVSGTATEGETLTAVTSTIVDADGLGSFGYQWLRDGSSITGATSSTYTLTQSDVGTEISVTVSYTDGSGTVESLTSEKTDYIYDDNGLQPYGGEITPGWLVFRAGSLSPDADWLPIQEAGNWPTGWEYSNVRYQYTITSFADLKSTFNSTSFPSSWSSGAPEGNVYLPFSYSHKDFADSIVIYSSLPSPADGKTYGDPIVTLGTELYTDDYVWAEIPNLQVGWVKILGTTELGQVLSADVSSELNVSNLKYQWLRDGAEITGATAATYLLGPSDIGKNISLALEYNSASMGTRLATSYETPAIANKTYANFADYRTDVVALTQGSHVEVLDLGQIDFSAPGRVTVSINGQDVATYDTSYSDAEYSSETWANTATYVAGWLSSYIRAWTDGVYAEHGGLPTGANATDYFDQGDGKQHQPLIYLEGSTDETLNATVKFENGTTGAISTYVSIEDPTVDAEGPILTSLSIRDTTVSVSETMYIDYTFTDENALSYFLIQYEKPTADGYASDYLSFGEDDYDGVIELLITDTMASGEYQLNYITVEDDLGNESNYFHNGGLNGQHPVGSTHTFDFDLLDFNVTNPVTVDAEGPTLTSMSIRDTTVNVGETMYIDYTFTDANPLSYFLIQYEKPTADGYASDYLSFGEDDYDGVIELLITDTMASGEYQLTYITVEDDLGNESNYFHNGGLNGQHPVGSTHTFDFDLLDFNVTNPVTVDAEGPTLTSMSIRDTTVSVGETMYIDYTFTDANPLSYFLIQYEKPTADGYASDYLSFGEDDYDGVIELLITDTMTSGEYQLTYITVEDDLGNESNYFHNGGLNGQHPVGSTHTFDFDLLDFEIIA